MVLRALSRDPSRRPSATELAQWAASLDVTSLAPSAPGAVGAAVTPGAAPHTIADQSDWRAWPTSTRPLMPVGPDDVRDLLPPVTYGQSAERAQPGGYPGAPDPAYGAGQALALAGGAALAPAGAGAGAGAGAVGFGAAGGLAAGQLVPLDGRTITGQGAGAGQLTSGPSQAIPFGASQARGAGRSVAGLSPWSPLVIASVVIVAAASIMAPIVGTAAALALFVILRAIATTGRQLGRRAAADGRRAGAAFAALVLFPVSVLRAVIGLVLLAPVALLGGCVAAAATIIAVPVHPLPQAVAFGAGTLVAIVGLGPGSAGSRSLLASMYSWAARTPGQRAVTYVGILSVCTWAGITAWYQAPAAAYWPVVGLHAQLEHLPALHKALADARHSLIRLAQQLGL
jgi:hypothetical protein